MSKGSHEHNGDALTVPADETCLFIAHELAWSVLWSVIAQSEHRTRLEHPFLGPVVASGGRRLRGQDRLAPERRWRAMKAISLWQPWASLWVAGVKIHETRHWPTDRRGPLLIASALAGGSIAAPPPQERLL